MWDLNILDVAPCFSSDFRVLRLNYIIKKNKKKAVLLHARASRAAWAGCTLRNDYEIPRHLPSSVHAHSSSLHTADPSAGHSEHHHLLDSFGGIACPTTGPSQPGRSRAVSEPCPSHLILPPTGLARVKVWTSQYGII